MSYFKGVLFQIKITEDSSSQKGAIRTRTYPATARQQFSFIDHENVEAAVEQWALKNPLLCSLLVREMASPLMKSSWRMTQTCPENQTTQWNQPDLDQLVDEFLNDSNLEITAEEMDEHTRCIYRGLRNPFFGVLHGMLGTITSFTMNI